jgi:hypothetical protein
VNPTNAQVLLYRFKAHVPLRMSSNEFLPSVLLPEQKPTAVLASRVQETNKLPIPLLAQKCHQRHSHLEVNHTRNQAGEPTERAMRGARNCTTYHGAGAAPLAVNHSLATMSRMRMLGGLQRIKESHFLSEFAR